MKCVAISGGSGFVGSELSAYLGQNGFDVKIIKRDDLKDENKLIKIVENTNVLINLSGANIISRWSEEYKRVLRSSRIDTTKSLVNAIQKAKTKPELFISTSAVGIYSDTSCHDEENFTLGDGFLSKLCKEWEECAFKASAFQVRVCVFRFGIVLGNGGALKKMLPPFRFGLGGNIGDGRQHFCFIHIKDLLRAYSLMVENKNLQGIFNLAAPTPTTNASLTKTLGKRVGMPTVFPIPKFVLKLIFGEGARVLTSGQCAKPKRLLDSGFKFEFKNIHEAILDLVK